MATKTKKLKLKKGAKFSFDFIPIVENLCSAGCSRKDVGIILGVSTNTVNSWAHRYPQVKEAFKNAKQMAAQYLISKGIRAAVGYEYEEVDEVYQSVPDGEGGFEEVLKTRTVHKRTQKENPSLLQFFLTNFSDGEFTSVKKLEITERKAHIDLHGTLEANDIRRLAGKLVDIVDEKTIEAEIIEVK